MSFQRHNVTQHHKCYMKCIGYLPSSSDLKLSYCIYFWAPISCSCASELVLLLLLEICKQMYCFFKAKWICMPNVQRMCSKTVRQAGASCLLLPPADLFPKERKEQNFQEQFYQCVLGEQNTHLTSATYLCHVSMWKCFHRGLALSAFHQADQSTEFLSRYGHTKSSPSWMSKC